MNKLLLIFILIGMCSLHSQQAIYKDMILAKVNGKIITRFELEQMTQRYQRQIAQTYPKEIAQRKIAELKVSALNKFIEDIIIKDEFTSKGYKVPKAYIDKELRREIQSRTGGDRSKFIAMLDRSGLSMEEFRDQLRDSLSVSMLLDENVRRKINISPIDIARFYEKNRAKFLTPLELRSSIIMISIKDRDEKQFKQRTEEITLALKTEGFAAVANKFSDLKTTTGGDMGFKKPAELNNAFRSTLLELEVGKVSKPVKHGDNLFIFKLTEKRGGDAKKLEDVRSYIKSYLSDQDEMRFRHEFISQLRKNASIEDFSKKGIAKNYLPSLKNTALLPVNLKVKTFWSTPICSMPWLAPWIYSKVKTSSKWALAQVSLLASLSKPAVS